MTSLPGLFTISIKTCLYFLTVLQGIKLDPITIAHRISTRHGVIKMKRILIVDDEEMILKVTVKTFEKYGTCKAVTNGKDTLRIFKQAFENDEAFQLVILDLSLEDIEGLDVLKAIRKLEFENAVDPGEGAVIIVVTGNNEKNMVKECIKSGCNDYILKPLKPEIVRKKLERFDIWPLPEEKSKKDEADIE